MSGSGELRLGLQHHGVTSAAVEYGRESHERPQPTLPRRFEQWLEANLLRRANV